MSHKKSARRLKTLTKQMDRILDEIYEICRNEPGWGETMRHNGLVQIRCGIEHTESVANRMKEHASFDDWDAADKAESAERIRKSMMEG
jgi:hypothetical protein